MVSSHLQYHRVPDCLADKRRDDLQGLSLGILVASLYTVAIRRSRDHRRGNSRSRSRTAWTWLLLSMATSGRLYSAMWSEDCGRSSS